jgi:anti-sigma B factor antagonist
MAFRITTETSNGIASMTLAGELDASVASAFKDEVTKVAGERPRRLVLFVDELEYMASAGLRVLIFAKQKLGSTVEMFVVGARPGVLETLQLTGFHYSVTLLDEYDSAGHEVGP